MDDKMEEIRDNQQAQAGENQKLSEVKSRKRILQGKVTSAKPNKTIVVTIERQVAHPLYKKYYKQSKKFRAHDENNSSREGDIVKIQESKPLSALKRWTLVEIVERAK
jgi:small subunit ribosomal protein S17